MQYAYPLLAIFIWAGNTVVNKLAVGSIFPAEIGFYRWLLAALLFTPFMLKPVIAQWSIIRPNLGKIFILGVLGMAVYQSLAYYAASLTSATNMGIILSLMPLMALTAAIISLGQRLTFGALSGAVLSFAGVAVVVSSGSLGTLLQHGVNLGDAMMLVATWPTRLQHLAEKMAAAPAAVGVAVSAGAGGRGGAVSAVSVLGKSRVGLGEYSVGAVRLPVGLDARTIGLDALGENPGPSRTTLFFNLLPLITALIAALVLKEALALYHLVGGLLTLGGVILSERWTTPVGRKLGVA